MAVGKPLTPVEFEFMTILWELGEGTVHDVIDKLSPERDLAYTSVATILRILQKKEVLAVRRQGRQYVFQPVLERSEFEKKSVSQLVDEVFLGKPAELVACLLDEKELSIDEINSIANSGF